MTRLCHSVGGYSGRVQRRDHSPHLPRCTQSRSDPQVKESRRRPLLYNRVSLLDHSLAISVRQAVVPAQPVVTYF